MALQIVARGFSPPNPGSTAFIVTRGFGGYGVIIPGIDRPCVTLTQRANPTATLTARANPSATLTQRANPTATLTRRGCTDG